MQKTKILFVDDEIDILELLKDTFSAEYEVFVARSGQEALEIKNRNNIHIIYTDLNLIGKSGVELCEEIRKTDAISIICAFTGYIDFHQGSELRRSGFDDLLIKPLHMDDLAVLVKESENRLNRCLECCNK